MRINLLYWLLAVLNFGSLYAADSLQAFPDCKLVEQPWSDGDSFSVLFPDQKEITVRLYGADCLEMHVKGDNSNAQRLREQRRYFGITDINIARSFGEKAREEVLEVLSKPFTVHTNFADGRGDGKFKRFYGFVTLSSGEDLATWLVKKGLARAFGVIHTTPDGTIGKEYQAQLRDLEMAAAQSGQGAWASTDWEKLSAERQQARAEATEIEKIKGTEKAVLEGSINPNTAARDELMLLPGVGEGTANRIIETRQIKQFKQAEDLLEVPGIGPAKLEKLKALLQF